MKPCLCDFFAVPRRPHTAVVGARWLSNGLEGLERGADVPRRASDASNGPLDRPSPTRGGSRRRCRPRRRPCNL